MPSTALITCKTGYEKILARELALYHIDLETKGREWVLAVWQEPNASRPSANPLSDLCFGHHILKNPVPVRATSVNSLTEKLVTLFITQLGQTRVTEPWPLSFSAADQEQLTRHARSVQKSWSAKITKRMSHVSRLAREGVPQAAGLAQGFFVHLTDFNQAFVAFGARSGGQQRMKMDPRAPSRSYLKTEEAFRIFGTEPQVGETVIDLGAAPGGWSFSALKRGARVTAVDNGPLKDPVRSHPNLLHLETDALRYRPEHAQPADWLLCDIIEKPDVILNLLQKWLNQRWCRNFVVNIKVGRNDPILLLKRIRDPKKGLLPDCRQLDIRQLYHDREEITLMGQTK